MWTANVPPARATSGTTIVEDTVWLSGPLLVLIEPADVDSEMSIPRFTRAEIFRSKVCIPNVMRPSPADCPEPDNLIV